MNEYKAIVLFAGSENGALEHNLSAQEEQHDYVPIAEENYHVVYVESFRVDYALNHSPQDLCYDMYCHCQASGGYNWLDTHDTLYNYLKEIECHRAMMDGDCIIIQMHKAVEVYRFIEAEVVLYSGWTLLEFAIDGLPEWIEREVYIVNELLQ